MNWITRSRSNCEGIVESFIQKKRAGEARFFITYIGWELKVE